jgi:DNA polymerase-3 subunit beta
VKVECQRRDLLDALNFAGGAASQRSALQILTTVRLDAGEGGLTLLGCDGEMWAQRKILAHVESPGALCVSSQLLKDVVSNLPDGQMSLEIEGTSLYLRQGASEYRMMVLPAEEFPSIPEVTENSQLTVTMGELRTAVDSVGYAVAEDQSRPQLTGVLFIYDGSMLTLVATDTHRLAVCRLEKDGIGSKLHAILPAKALRSIKSLPLGDDETVTVRFDEVRLGVDAGDSKVVSQLLAGAFPDWERVVPKEFTRTWTIDRSELLDNVKRTLVIAKDSAYRIRFSGHGDQVQLTARSEDKGEAKEMVSVVSKDGDIEIAFNGRFVQDALASLRSQGVRAEFTEASRAAVFRPIEGGENQFCVIMPMALG